MFKDIAIVVENGPSKNCLYRAMPGETIIVGRGPHAKLSLIDFRLSREHFAVSHDREKWTISDLNSRHGTLLNGDVDLSPGLRAGDIIQAGDTRFRVVFERNDMRVDESEPKRKKNKRRRKWLDCFLGR